MREAWTAQEGVEGRARHAGTLPSTFEKPRQGGASLQGVAPGGQKCQCTGKTGQPVW